jgi:hypothetical protein
VDDEPSEHDEIAGQRDEQACILDEDGLLKREKGCDPERPDRAEGGGLPDREQTDAADEDLQDASSGRGFGDRMPIPEIAVESADNRELEQQGEQTELNESGNHYPPFGSL